MKITVLAGGLSPERDVSLSSGSLIAQALTSRGHQVLLADIYEGIPSWEKPDILFQSETGTSYSIEAKEPNLKKLIEKNGGRKDWIGPHILDACQASDVVFLALHGAYGENGQLQATLDSYNIRYTGSNYQGCLLAMDKSLTKILLDQAGITNAPWILFDTTKEDISVILEKIGLPCVIKPCNCGSSVGISIVEQKEELTQALQKAAEYESKILVEKKIEGREFSVGIIGDKAYPPIEIIPKEGFYDYKNKYQSGLTTEICPAPLTPEQNKKIKEAALSVHHTLRLGSYSRIDFIMDKEDNFYCLEANALPGMTPTSLLPQEAAQEGLDFPSLCEKIVQLALDK